MRAFSAARRVALAVLLVGAAVHPAPAQDGGGQAAAPNWTVNCSGAAGQAELTCTLSQALYVKDKGQRVLTAVVTKKAGKSVLNLGLPHGLDLPKGVDVWIDDAQRRNHPIATADQKGSYAIVAMDDAMLAAMRKGKVLNVAIKAYSGDEVILQLSLTGFSAGYARL